MGLLESYFNRINDELTHITHNLLIDDIINLSLVNSKFNRCLWQNDLFWMSKLSSELGIVTEKPKEKRSKDGFWRNLYFNSFTIWVVGQNFDLKFGIINKEVSQLTQMPNLKAIQIKSSNGHTVAIDLNNNIYVWGKNRYGELGLGDTRDRYVPTLLPGIKARSIACGLGTSFIINSKDELLGFGAYDDLKLANWPTSGFVSQDYLSEPMHHPQLILNRKIKEVFSGQGFTVIKDYKDKIWGYGTNFSGQLSNDEVYHVKPVLLTDIKVKQLTAGSYHTLIIDYDDNVWACGGNCDGRLGLGITTEISIFTQIEGIKAKRVIAGENSSAIINMDNELFMFGSNNHGQLGLGDTKNRSVPVKVSNIKVKDVSLCSQHSILLDINGNVWVCGVKWENFTTKCTYQKYDEKNLLLTPTLLPNIKARKVIALDNAAIIIGINDQQ
jgi:alpha-tubulin suppressor-like RCC1 family protein